MARVNVVSLVDAVADDLRQRILKGDLEPDEALAEVDIATRYEVARPTAKAAIEQLVQSRLLHRSAHKTARVVRLAPQDARDIYLGREIIEAEVMRRLARDHVVPAAATAANAEIAALPADSPRDVVGPDMRFHTALIDSVGSARLSRTYASLASEVVFCMSQVQGASLLPTALIVAEHGRILELIAAGDGDGAAAMISVHISRARELLVARLGGEPGPEASVGSSLI